MFPVGSDSVVVSGGWVPVGVTEPNVAELVVSAVGAVVEFIFATRPMMTPTAPKTNATATATTAGTTHGDRLGLSL